VVNTRPSGDGTRREIQVLRAVAVTAVIAFHLWPDQVSGGYVGVDVFFVVSGFLITAHLLRELDTTGTVRLRRFWARRIRRLLPASLAVILLTTVAILTLVPKFYWPTFLPEAIASAFYVENWALAANSVDYLAAENAPSPFQHFWSLAVEEQFYLIWPVLIVLTALVARLAAHAGPAGVRRAVVVALGVVAAGSLVYSIVATSATPDVAYFSSFTRAWEFGAGALLAALVGQWRPGRALGVTTTVVGFAAILASVFLFGAATPFPGWAALLPIAGTVLVILAGEPDVGPIRATYGFAPLRWMGDVSYSAYLVHWPPIVILPYVLGRDLGPLERLALFAVTWVLAAASYTWVENAARGRPLTRVWPTFASGLAGMLVVLIVAGIGYAVVRREAATPDPPFEALTATQQDCFGAGSLDPEFAEACTEVSFADVTPSRLRMADDIPPIYGDECRTSPVDDQLKACEFGDSASSEIAVLVGDSHAAQWFPAVEALAVERGWRLIVYFKAACAFSTAADAMTDVESRTSCVRWNDDVVAELAGLEPDWVFTSATRGTTFESQGSVSADEVAVTGFAERWAALVADRARVVVFVDTPEMDRTTIDCVVGSTGPRPDCARDESAALARPDYLTPASGRVPGTTLVDLNDRLCPDGSCPAVIGAVIAYRDTSSHLTETFAKTLLPMLRAAIPGQDGDQDQP
jgi:peptidoglycan/LPS O-acetylase OafA/YrhL